jgi:hypothetical protein
MIYYAHAGFPKAEAALLDELLPKWNARVQPEVDAGRANAARFELRLRPALGGLGVFAGNSVPRGACLAYYSGQLMKGAHQRGAYNMNTKMRFNLSRKRSGMKRRAKHVYVNGDPELVPQAAEMLGSFINHSCTPNSKAFGEPKRVGCKAGRSLTLQLIRFEALRDLARDEEVTIDYGREYVEENRSAAAGYTPCLCNGGRCPRGRMMRACR